MWRELTNVKVFGLNKIEDEVNSYRKKMLSELFGTFLFSCVLSSFLLLLVCLFGLNIYIVYVGFFVFILLILFFLSDFFKYFKKYNIIIKDYNLLKGRIDVVEYLIIPDSNGYDERVEVRVNGEICTLFDDISYRKDLELNILDVENNLLIVKKEKK